MMPSSAKRAAAASGSGSMRDTFEVVLSRLWSSSSWSDLSYAPVHKEFRPVYEARVFRREESDGLRHLRGVAKTAHRDCAGELLKQGVLVIRRHEAGETRCRNWARAHDVDANAPRGELENPGPGEASNCGFGRAVHAEARGSLPPSGRTREDHGAAFLHQRQGLLDREEQSLHVRSEDPVDVLRGDGLERKHVSATGVREHHVEATRVPGDLFVKPVEIRDVRHVGLDANGAAPNRASGVRHLGPASASDEESYTAIGQLVR